MRLGQGPEKLGGTLPIKGEVLFGFRIHRVDVGQRGWESDMKESLKAHCSNMDDPKGAIEAATKAIGGNDLAQRENDLILNAFRLSRFDPHGDGHAWTSVLEYLERLNRGAFDLIKSTKVNGNDISQITDLFLSIDAVGLGLEASVLAHRG